MFYSNVAEMRTKHKDAFFKKHGVKLGFMSAFIKASAHALQSEPTVNAGQRSFSFQECLWNDNDNDDDDNDDGGSRCRIDDEDDNSNSQLLSWSLSW